MDDVKHECEGLKKSQLVMHYCRNINAYMYSGWHLFEGFDCMCRVPFDFCPRCGVELKTEEKKAAA